MLAALLTKKKALREERLENDRGFTLIELLVVVVIIGILIAIAIPLYSNYKKGAENKSAASDVRNAIPVIEQYYTDNSSAYPASAVSASAGATITIGTGTINVSSGNYVAYFRGTASPGTGITTYAVCGWNNDGNKLYVYSSITGQTTSATSPTSIPTSAACGTAASVS